MNVLPSQQCQILGRTFTYGDTITDDGAVLRERSLAAAKTGVLTTRTDANTGSLTMDAGHGFATSDKIDLYWATGSRVNITVGTVSTNVVPIDLGGGDDLPPATTPVTAMKPTVLECTVTAANVKGVMVGASGTPCIARFMDGSNADVGSAIQCVPGTKQLIWVEGMGTGDCPIADDVAKVALSHGESSGARTVTVVAAVNG